MINLNKIPTIQPSFNETDFEIDKLNTFFEQYIKNQQYTQNDWYEFSNWYESIYHQKPNQI